MSASHWKYACAVAVAVIMVSSALAVVGGISGSSVARPLGTPTTSSAMESVTSAPTVASSPTTSAAPTAAAAAPAVTSSPSVSTAKVLGINSALAASVNAGEQRFLANGGNPAAYHPPNLHQAPPLSETHNAVTPLYYVAPAPMGVAYYGLSNTTGSIQSTTVNTTSLVGSYTTTDKLGTEVQELDFGGASNQEAYGAQLNSVLVNVTLKGQTSFGANPNAPSGCPGFPSSACPNQFWLQNYIEYTVNTGVLQVGDEIWNFSNPTADWASSQSSGTNTIAGFGTVQEGELYALAGSGYAFSLTISYPFTVDLYINATRGPCHTDSTPGTGIGSCGSVSTTEPVNELFMNYSIYNSVGARVCPATEPTGRVCGEYDDVFFNSVGASNPTGVPVYGPNGRVGSATIQANGSAYDPVGLTNDYEMDYGIGSDDGATTGVVYANGVVGIDYCQNAHAATSGICSAYSATPAAVDFGGETGETSTGEVSYWTQAGNLAPGVTGPKTNIVHQVTGPSLLIGLWNMTGSAYPAGAGGEPLSYANIAPANAWVGIAQGASQTNQSLFQAAPTFGWFSYWKGSGGAPTATTLGPNLYLPAAMYTVEVMLSGYDPVIQNVNLLSSGQAPSISLHADASTGVYTPMWAFSATDLANLSVSGAGSSGSPYMLLGSSPTVGAPYGVSGSLSWLFSNQNDYLFTVWIGAYVNTTTAYAQFNPAPSLAMIYPSWQLAALSQFNVPTTNQFQFYFYHVQNLVLAGGAHIYAWANSEATTLYSVVCNTCTNVLVAHNTFAVSNDGIEFENGGTTAGTLVGNALPNTRNVLWGNNLAPYPQPTFTGLETPSHLITFATESFDRIYNNNFANFSTASDNGISGVSATDFQWWNATCQGGYNPLGSTVYPGATPCEPLSYSQTLDGYVLTGSIVGSSYQGGNFWATYGNVFNPYVNIPFIARTTSPTSGGFTSTTIAGAHGDYAPLLLQRVYAVSFTESGLLTGNSWAIRTVGVPIYAPSPATTLLTNTLNTTTVSATLLTNIQYVPNGTYPWTLASHTSPSVASFGSGVVTVSGSSIAITIPFLWPVTFTETGLTTGTAWAASFNGKLQTGTGHSLNFSAPVGSYAYSVSAIPTGWIASPASGSAAATAGSTTTVTITFSSASALTYPVYFTASGLPSGTNWQVWLNSTDGGSNYHQIGTTATLTISAKADSYTFQVGSLVGSTSSPSSGSVVVTNVAVSVGITFSTIVYTVTFTEVNLLSGTLWAVSFGGVLHWSTATTISFQVAQGTYAWTVAYVSGYTVVSTSTSSPTTVSGTTGITVTFS